MSHTSLIFSTLNDKSYKCNKEEGVGLVITQMPIWFNRKKPLQTNQFYLIILQYKVAEAQCLI